MASVEWWMNLGERGSGSRSARPAMTRRGFSRARTVLAQLRAEVATLRRDNLELRQQAGYWQSMHARASERLRALQQDNEQLRGEVARRNAQLFGQKSQQQSRQDRSNHLDGLDDEDGGNGGPQPQAAPRPRTG